MRHVVTRLIVPALLAITPYLASYGAPSCCLAAQAASESLPPPPLSVDRNAYDPRDPSVRVIQLSRPRDTRWLMYQAGNAVIVIGYRTFLQGFSPTRGPSAVNSLLSRLSLYFKDRTVLIANRDLDEEMLSIFANEMGNWLWFGDAHVFDKRTGGYAERIKGSLTSGPAGFTFMFMDGEVFHKHLEGNCSAQGGRCGGIAGITCCDGLECELPKVNITDAVGTCVRRR